MASVVLLVLVGCSGGVTGKGRDRVPVAVGPSAPSSGKGAPGAEIAFEANMGQTDPQVKFLSRRPGSTLFLTEAEAVLALSAPGAPGEAKGAETVLRMRLAGAGAEPEVRGLRQLPGVANSFSGADPARWAAGAARYASVGYDGVYPGIDLVFHGDSGRLEYDFVVAAGADPSVVGVSFEGARGMRLGPRGDLVFDTAGGALVQPRPFIYQEVDGRRVEVAGGYLLGPEGRVGFEVGGYDPTRTLVIDPVLPLASYLGGGQDDAGTSVAVDPAGSAYVTGWTRSADFPSAASGTSTYGGDGPRTAGSCDRIGVGCGDAFVTKLKADGSGPAWSTYLGGSGSDSGLGVAVDGAGNAYVTGQTNSPDFPLKGGSPVEPGAAPDFAATGPDAFVAKLDPGGAVLYTALLGGQGGGVGKAVAVDPAGKMYVTGASKRGFQGRNVEGGLGEGGAFVAKPECTDRVRRIGRAGLKPVMEGVGCPNGWACLCGAGSGP